MLHGRRLGSKCLKIVSKKAAPRSAAEQHLAGRHQSSKMEDLRICAMIREVLQSGVRDDPVGATWDGRAQRIATNSIV